MAEKLLEYYQYVESEHGIEAKMELARATNLPTSKASVEDDSEENIARFRSAIERITGDEPPEL